LTSDPRAQLGRLAEDHAARWLETQGAQIVLRNYRRRSGELDLIAIHRGCLLIVEVRLRSPSRFGDGAESVDAGKQARIIRTARQLLQQRADLARLPVRFDVIAVRPDPDAEGGLHLEWITHAFTTRA